MTIPAFAWSIIAIIATVALLYLFLTRTALGRGFKVLLRQMQRTPVTTQYPDQKREPQPRFHGRHQLNRYEDGLEKCIGCELCAWACPADAIFVQGADNTVEARFSPGERYASDYQINYNRCIFCAMCIEACPTRALTMTHEYELSADSRAGLIYTKERLLAPLPEGGEPTPQRDEDVRARGVNYYGGLAATPPELHGGGFAAAGPRPMRRASEWLGPLREREVTAPDGADRDGLVDSDQRSIPLGRDTSHLREAKGHVDTPYLDQDESGGTRRSDRSLARPGARDAQDRDDREARDDRDDRGGEGDR